MAPVSLAGANATRVVVAIVAIDGNADGGSIPTIDIGLQVSSDGFNWSLATPGMPVSAQATAPGVATFEASGLAHAWARLLLTITNGDGEESKDAYCILAARFHLADV